MAVDTDCAFDIVVYRLCLLCTLDKHGDSALSCRTASPPLASHADAGQ